MIHREAPATLWPSHLMRWVFRMDELMASKDLVTSFPAFLSSSFIILGFGYNFPLLKVVTRTFKQNKYCPDSLDLGTFIFPKSVAPSSVQGKGRGGA